LEAFCISVRDRLKTFPFPLILSTSSFAAELQVLFQFASDICTASVFSGFELKEDDPKDTEGFKRKFIAMLSIGIKGYTAAEPKEERRDETAKTPTSRLQRI
jgi:hypothetical protein